MREEMYYPYLRGKQYELIALRELIEKKLISDNIIPIVEPVKASPSFLSFMKVYTEANRSFGVIQNPEHGNFATKLKEQDMEDYKDKYLSFSSSNCCLPVHILNNKFNEKPPASLKRKSIAVCVDVDTIEIIPNYIKKYNIDRLMIPDERVFKREITGDKILMADNFKKKQRNVDYIESVDNFFSDDHLHYEEEGYKGFSDFSIIGKEYIESGFAPYAVAIHMVYFDKDKKLRVHHFVSKTNVDNDNTPGKFGEALEKLIKSTVINNDTYAYNELKKYYDNRTYAGLGVIKKLSIMHHIELVSKFLQGKI
jgi:hypothetical protein